MGHIVFGAPSIHRFHLHERLQRELRFRGHRVTWLCTDPAAATFAEAQTMPVLRVLPGRQEPTAHAPLRELAELECHRLGLQPHGRHRARRERRLGTLLPGLLRFFEAWAPDLVFLHADRSGDQRLIHFLARECGSRLLWTGDGLLPHTIQCDESGLDGEASAVRRPAAHYRPVRPDPAFLDAARAALLARSEPLPLSRRPVIAPSAMRRLRDRLAAFWPGDAEPAPLHAWRSALGRVPQAPTTVELPRAPFVCVLLQDQDDPRLRLDAPMAPDPVTLVRAVRAAAALVDPALPIVAVLPERGLPARQLRGLGEMHGVLPELPHAAPDAVATAAVTVTVNHPLGAASLLLGTPVVHLGRALYGLPGVTVTGSLDDLPRHLTAATALDQPHLRERFLTWLLAHGHVWCDADQPDHNGIAGLVQEIESRLQDRSPTGLQLRYRSGPSWPITAEGTPA